MRARRSIYIFLLLLAGLLDACSLPSDRQTAAQDLAAQQLVWPQTAAPPRIRFIKSVSSPVDLGIKQSWWNRLIRTITGDDKQVQLVRPGDVAVDGDLIGVADPGAQSLWLLEPTAGRFQRIRSAAKDQALISPVAVTFAESGKRIYLADSYRAAILVYDRDGNYIASIENSLLERPAGLAYDAATSRLYVSDSATHRILVFTGNGSLLKTLGRRGTDPGEFNFPTHLTVDRTGTLYVIDALGYRVQLLNRDGTFLKSFGHHGNGSGDFAAPKGIAVDSEGNIYIVDALFDTVQIFDRNGRYLLNFGMRGPAYGQFWLPNGLFVDSRDRIYIADAYNQRIQIFQYIRQGDGDG